MTNVDILNELGRATRLPPHRLGGFCSKHQMYVRFGLYRKICNRRARVLRKRGENVFWSIEMDSYLWEPKK